jgi:hypothetical protein
MEHLSQTHDLAPGFLGICPVLVACAFLAALVVIASSRPVISVRCFSSSSLAKEKNWRGFVRCCVQWRESSS